MKEIKLMLFVLFMFFGLQGIAIAEVKGDNWYKSAKVSTQKVSFKTQYGGKVVGNLFIPKDLVESENSKDDIAKMTQMQASFTEKIIRQKKDEWFWFHKRFKAKYDYIYKQKPTESIK
ncbi:MAG: hypothetical protein K2P17_03100 [Helicobacteraceae bacterium]|nr:hypothetical protein [Helicobacteraceae bacterium]